MAFATLEEAWGMPVLERPAAPLAAEIQPSRRRVPHQARRVVATADEREERRGPRFRPPYEDVKTHASVEVHTAQRVLARAYVDHGIAGVLALMPREAAEELGGGAGHHHGRRRGGALWDMLNTPETLLFVLLCAFAMLVLWDSWRSSEAVPSMASLHMSPFPLSS